MLLLVPFRKRFSINNLFSGRPFRSAGIPSDVEERAGDQQLGVPLNPRGQKWILLNTSGFSFSPPPLCVGEGVVVKVITGLIIKNSWLRNFFYPLPDTPPPSISAEWDAGGQVPKGPQITEFNPYLRAGGGEG